MTSIARIYIDEVRGGLDETVVPVFAPDTVIEPGTIGSFDDGTFVPRGHLRERGATVVAQDGPPTPSWTFRSTGKVDLAPAAEVGLADGTKVFSAKLSFSGSRGVVASFQDVVESAVIDADDFDRVIWETYLAGKLKEDRLVVWSVRRAARGTVVVASEKGASVELTAPILGTLTFDGVAAGVTFGSSHGIGYSVSGAALTTFVRLKRVTPQGKASVEDVHGFEPGDAPGKQPPSVEPVRLDDLLTSGQ